LCKKKQLGKKNEGKGGHQNEKQTGVVLLRVWGGGGWGGLGEGGCACVGVVRDGWQSGAWGRGRGGGGVGVCVWLVGLSKKGGGLAKKTGRGNSP